MIMITFFVVCIVVLALLVIAMIKDYRSFTRSLRAIDEFIKLTKSKMKGK